MALTREKKEQVVSEIKSLLADSMMTVVAKYQGTPVKAMQQLRSAVAADGTTLCVVKNRLFMKALSQNDRLREVDTSGLIGQLLYAFNDSDEVAPARSLADFAKTNPQLEFVAAITADGQLLESSAVQDLASLPTKNILQAQLIATISAPLSGFVDVLAGNLRGLMNVLNARSESMNYK